MDIMADLVAAALAVRQRAYAPYSGYAVGAAILGDDGQIHVGCNVENAAYPLGQCAEAGAISAMVVAGCRRWTQMVVIGGDAATAAMPCGGCRQRLHEFAAVGAVVAVATPQGNILHRMLLADLLPLPFKAEGACTC